MEVIIIMVEMSGWCLRKDYATQPLGLWGISVCTPPSLNLTQRHFPACPLASSGICERGQWRQVGWQPGAWALAPKGKWGRACLGTAEPALHNDVDSALESV